MTRHKQELGRWGESQAAEFLTRKGYQVLERNLRTPYGEIDLIASQEGALVFVEVKTRTTQKFGLPEEAITPQKLEHMIESAQHYLQERPEPEVDWRVDVIAIQRQADGEADIVHFENVGV